jgi:hypothetical protein
MLNSETTDPFGAAHFPLLVAADLQDNLMTATNDLDRLQTLLSHACDELMVSFHGASERIRALDPSGDAFEGVLERLGGAITALQFQDMASQLIAHTHKRHPISFMANNVAWHHKVPSAEQMTQALAELETSS